MSARRGGKAAFDASAPTPAIQLLGKASAKARAETRWHLMLIIFMRVTALLWLLQGLLHWLDILSQERSILETAPPRHAAALALFSVLDLVAAVGLWLITLWGGVLWILAVAAQMAAIFFARDLFAAPDLAFMTDAALLTLYLFLTYRAGREESELRDG